MKGKKARSVTIASSAWKAFYETPDGRVAIAQLMTEFGFFAAPAPGSDLARATGQRDVLVRLNELINRKPEDAPSDSRDDDDILDRIMRS